MICPDCDTYVVEDVCECPRAIWIRSEDVLAVKGEDGTVYPHIPGLRGDPPSSRLVKFTLAD